MRTLYLLPVIVLGVGCGRSQEAKTPVTAAPTSPAATATQAAPAPAGDNKPTTPATAEADAGAAPTPAPTVKGNAAGGTEAAGGGGANVAGEVVFKTHELPAATKTMAAFKPATSGFKFQNYGNSDGYTNLTVTEARRMFGDQVCASLHDGKCILTPAAEQWLESSNKSMGGGHCEGFAALALLIERGQIDPKTFGAPTVAELEIKDNEKLQREIAYWFVTQGVMPMAQAEDKTLTPVQVVEKISASLTGGDTYTLGIYGPGYTMGHATTPYAVVDKGNDIVWIMHYDNNYPGEEKYIEVDKKANTWSYTTAADPSAAEHAYKGDAETKTLTIAPTSIRTGALTCHFCGAVDAPGGASGAAGIDKGAAKGSAGGAETVEMREVVLNGGGNLLITDEAGKRLGYVDGKLEQEIPGAFFAADKSSDTATEDEPSYFVPAGHALKITLDGTGLAADTSSTLSLLGRGYTLAVEGVSLSSDQKDEIDFAADFSRVSYTTEKGETPTLVIGIETAGADYEIEVEVSGEPGGQTVELAIDLAKGTFAVKVKGDPAAKPALSVKLTRIDDAGEQVYHHKGVAVGADQSVSFGYGAWGGDKTPLHVTVTDASGAVVSQEDAPDEE